MFLQKKNRLKAIPRECINSSSSLSGATSAPLSKPPSMVMMCLYLSRLSEKAVLFIIRHDVYSFFRIPFNGYGETPLISIAQAFAYLPLCEQVRSFGNHLLPLITAQYKSVESLLMRDRGWCFFNIKNGVSLWPCNLGKYIHHCGALLTLLGRRRCDVGDDRWVVSDDVLRFSMFKANGKR